MAFINGLEMRVMYSLSQLGYPKAQRAKKEDDIKKQFSENWMEEVSLVKTSAKLKVKR